MTELSGNSHVEVNGTEIALNDIINFRYEDDNTKLVIIARATFQKKLINAAKNLPVNIKFIQADDHTGELMTILDVTTQNVKYGIDQVGTMFVEKLEAVFDEPLF